MVDFLNDMVLSEGLESLSGILGGDEADTNDMFLFILSEEHLNPVSSVPFGFELDQSE